MAGARCTRRRRRAPALRVLAAAVVGLAAAGASGLSGFVAAPLQRGGYRGGQQPTAPRQFFSGFDFGSPAPSANAQQAYDLWSAAYPQAAKDGVYLGDAVDKAMILQRFAGMAGLFGEEVALDMVRKEPILLLYSSQGIEGSYGYMKGLETDETAGQALQIVQQNPRSLTVPAFEYQRTKPSLSGMMTASTVIDAVRPLGPAGLAVVIFGGFILLITILRPILYGVGGGPSLVSSIAGALPSLPSPKEFAEQNGINLASFVILIPIINVLQIAKKKYVDGKDI